MNMMSENQRRVELIHLEEPELEFRYSQRTQDPKEGLSIFGPYDADQPSHPKNISYGLIGTQEGIKQFEEFAKHIVSPTISARTERELDLWPPYPGFEAAFSSVFPLKPTKSYTIDHQSIVNAATNYDPNTRSWQTVNLYLEGVKSITEGEDRIDLIICITPDIIYEYVRPKGYVKQGHGEKIPRSIREERAKYKSLLPDEDFQIYSYSVDFRRQLKARAMIYNTPIQIIRESTMYIDHNTDTPPKHRRGLTPLSDRVWNIATTIYYKAQGKPWRLVTARAGVCYVGLVYSKTESTTEQNTACCAAQMFLDTGDGVVIRGNFGPWYSPQNKQLHLDQKEAQNLLTKVLETYRELHGQTLNEVFLHYRSYINDEEYQGFKSAIPQGVKLVAIRIRIEEDFKLFREGRYPVPRGTLLKLGNKTAYLWTNGYKPKLKTYDGAETPKPLRIDIQYGEADIVQVAEDILGLTKLNYNNCKLANTQPVTLEFSEDVGKILVTNPKIIDPKTQFRYYI